MSEIRRKHHAENPRKGWKHSEETKQKIKEGIIKHFKEYPRRKHTEEEKRKIGEKSRGHILSKESREKISKALKGKKRHYKNGHPMLGKHLPEETRKKISETLKNKPFNHDSRNCLCCSCKAKRGDVAMWCKGLTKETDERVRKISIAMTDWDFYNKYGCFKSQYPYSKSWTEDFKTKIRALYDNKCVVTGISSEKHKKMHGRDLIVHHWTYDKDETNPFYFVPVTMEIHGMTNASKNKEEWIELFNGIAEDRWCLIHGY